MTNAQTALTITPEVLSISAALVTAAERYKMLPTDSFPQAAARAMQVLKTSSVACGVAGILSRDANKLRHYLDDRTPEIATRRMPLLVGTDWQGVSTNGCRPTRRLQVLRRLLSNGE
jgi:hypothetical protein